MKIYNYKSLDSTNETAKEILIENAVITADMQTRGKGRMGKSFFSPEGGIYMSVILKPEKSFSCLSYMSAAAAVAVCRAIMKISELKPSVKWINDIYLGDKKAGGILIESLSDYLIVGIGLNLSEQNFPDDINAAALNIDLKKEVIAEKIAEELFFVVNDKNFIDDYKKLSNIIGEKIIVYDVHDNYIAFVHDISDIGELIIKKENESDFTVLNSVGTTIRKACV